MTRSSRTLNRVFLVLIGLGLLAGGAVLAVPAVRDLTPWRPDLADPMVLWILAGGCALFLVFAIAWIASRGRGRTTSALKTAHLQIDTRVVESIVSDALTSSPDILSVDAGSYRRRGADLVRIAVRTRRHPDLAAVRQSVASAIETLDAAIGTPLPLVVHITTGIRTSFAPARTTH
ncbi:hypothetical protein [Microbacterium sp. SLBN-146]|uniref:hypothetical protein n=1 Tax=Microbacterium sp. SLBN-146 TaxID=2768457 RepID=UPI00114EBEC9|nr:hypothetical protein [Microbacterium sp. SLBN-146]TQJ31529.1 hypothetical protein FBY39_2006 [Microbacterium sp. SLBN-146]